MLTLTACGAEVEGSSIASSLQQGGAKGSAESSVAMGDDDVIVGAAGAPADEPVVQPTEGTIYGVDDSELIGTVRRAPGSSLSGTVELYCCRAGAYDVYTYEGGSCDDTESWLVEKSARLAAVTCAGDAGKAPYVRDPSEAATLAVVIYDAAGAAVGCADFGAD